MNYDFSLNGKVALVTGGGRGLGEAFVRGLSSAGASVVVANRTFETAVAVAKSIEAGGGKAVPIQVDVTNAVSVEKMVEDAVYAFGTIDILINNAGINLRSPCTEMSEEDWDAVMNTNLKGAFLCCRAVGNLMKAKKKGKIINVASLLATRAMPNRGPYAASKGGLVQFTKVLAEEWASYNINVNAIGPGYVMTELNTKIMADKAAYDDITRHIPMGRWAITEEIVGPAIFLASEAADYVTGHVLYVDGGFLCM